MLLFRGQVSFADNGLKTRQTILKGANDCGKIFAGFSGGTSDGDYTGSWVSLCTAPLWCDNSNREVRNALKTNLRLISVRADLNPQRDLARPCASENSRQVENETARSAATK